jgi:manganese/iron transport system substrate-binding protein
LWVVGLISMNVSVMAQSAHAPSRRLIIVCSTTQIADLAKQVVGDRCEVHCILAPGADPHLYEPKGSDAKLVTSADLCLENGWHLEGNGWMRRLALNAGKTVVTCVEGVRPLELEEEGATFRDPHAWFTPENAAVYVRNIEQAVGSLDGRHREEYRARAELYLAQLRALHQWILRQVNQIPPEERILVTSHDAFNYFCSKYKFTSRAPRGWSTGEEVGAGITPQRRRATVDSIREFGVRAIFVETSVNSELIEEIAKEAGVRIGGKLYSDSMGIRGSAGESYIGMMRENVLTIVRALK